MVEGLENVSGPLRAPPLRLRRVRAYIIDQDVRWLEGLKVAQVDQNLATRPEPMFHSCRTSNQMRSMECVNDSGVAGKGLMEVDEKAVS